MKTDKKRIQAIRRIHRELNRDIAAMESIQWQTQWLNSRDSNSSSAASLTDAIGVLIKEAIHLHKGELRMFEIGNKTEMAKLTKKKEPTHA